MTDNVLADIADCTRELTTETRTNVIYALDRAPGINNPGTSRHRRRHHGLLVQLVAALAPGARGESGRSNASGSRSPVDDRICQALDGIARGWTTPGGQSVPGAYSLAGPNLRERTLAGAVRAVRARAHTWGSTDQAEAARALQAYVRLSKAALGLTVPAVNLGLVCPGCLIPLRVARDASTDVWCPNPQCLDTEGRRLVWPRTNWPFLLEQIQNGAA